MTTNFSYFLFLLIFTVSLTYSNGDGAAGKSSSTKIVGGTAAIRGEFPAQISLQRRLRNHFCGGTLINENHVLTAAHCVSNADTGVVDRPSAFLIMGDSLTVRPLTDPNSQTRDATHVFVHPNYDSNTMMNDVAVIRVSPAFEYSSTFYNAARITNTPATNDSCAVSGWGTLTNKGSASSTLQRVNVSIVDSVRCNRTYGGMIVREMICAGTEEGGKDSCQGDSGGGLYCGNRVAGIVSFGYDCGDAAFPGVYTNVAYYNDWIDYTLTWNEGSNTNVPTPTTRKPSAGSIKLTSLNAVVFGVYFVLIFR